MKLFKPKLKFSKPKLLTYIGCLGVPVLAILLFIGEYRFRNRPVHINIPAPIVIPVNARDDFLAAGLLARKIEAAHKSVTNSGRLLPGRRLCCVGEAL